MASITDEYVLDSPPESSGFRRSIVELFQLFVLFVRPGNRHARAMYEFYSKIPWGETSAYLNMGYWKTAKTFDEACQALAEIVGQAAELSPEDRVLDVGFGYGDQDLYWIERYSPRRIDGLNITPHQVATAKNRAVRRGLSDRLHFHVGSATAPPFEDGSFDKIIALESSSHFVTRDDFLRHAFRLLRSGGRLTLADPLPAESRKQGLATRIADYYWLSLTQIPKENFYPPNIYGQKLAEAGFTNVKIHSISDHVHEPFRRFLLQRLEDKEFMKKFSPIMRALFKFSRLLGRRASKKHYALKDVDYIIATADKLP